MCLLQAVMRFIYTLTTDRFFVLPHAKHSLMTPPG